MRKEQAKSDHFARDLLAKLNSPEANSAWKQFLERYSATIMLLAQQYEHRRDRVNDCFLFICEKLCDKSFARLLSYQPEGSASFRSWLNVVVANLCIDWGRHQYGRKRPFKSISQLPKLEQSVFKHKFQGQMNLHTCLAFLKPEFPDLTEPQLANAIHRINSILTPRQQWLLSTQHPQLLSIHDSATGPGNKEPIAAGPDPEQFSMAEQQSDRLEQALNRLSPQQRLLLKLRYQQDLSLKEIARLARLGNPFRTRRKIQQALKLLTSYMNE